MSDRQRSSRGPNNGRDNGPSGNSGPDLGLTAWDENTEPEKGRDLKKTFLVAGLAILSWVATYVGMLELIEANMGDLPIVHKIIIGFSVAMLMTMVVWLLDQMFQPHNLFAKLAYTGGYLFLSIISVGFGFGFYWKVLESRGEGTRGAESAISQVQAPLQTAAARMESLQNTLVKLRETSQSKAEIERTQGTSCPNSKPGDGPRRKLRDDDAGRFAFASDFVKGRISQVKDDMAAIEADLSKIVKDDKAILDKSGTRNEFMKAMNRRLDGTVTSFNAFRGDPQLKQIRNELAERADKSQFIDTQGKTYSCPDQQLATMIKSVVASIDALPVLDKPKITTVEGSDATIEAFRRLTASFYGALSFKLPPSSDELRELQKKAITQAEATAGGKPNAASIEQVGQGGLSKRDYVPLAIAIFVDLCLLLVSMGKAKSRMQGLVPKMKEAERGPVIQILSRFNEIHRDRQIRENFEIFRHVVFDFNGDYYAAIPLIAPYAVDRRRPNAYGPADVEALQQEAHLLGNFFTSFEQERLFARVVMPIISTARIQKKLWAQGSKFAHAEAFRLYKFKDGAWQEMILGAIMGAAKRVEADKRTRRIENDIFTRHTPGLDSDVRQMPDPRTGLHNTDLHSHMASAAAMAAATATAREPSYPNAAPQSFSSSVPRPDNGTYGRPVAPPPPPAPSDIRIHTPNSSDHRTTASRLFSGTQKLEQADIIVMPANSNTATAPLAAQQAPPSESLEPGRSVEVAATERSFTFRLPAEDLPESLKAALSAPARNAATAAAGLNVDAPLQLAQAEAAAPDAPTLETKAFFDAVDGKTLAENQAHALGGKADDSLPAWNEPALADTNLTTNVDVDNITRWFGRDRHRA